MRHPEFIILKYFYIKEMQEKSHGTIPKLVLRNLYHQAVCTVHQS